MVDGPHYFRIVTKIYRDDRIFFSNPEVIFSSDRDKFYGLMNVYDEQNTFINLENTLRFGIKEQNKFWSL